MKYLSMFGTERIKHGIQFRISGGISTVLSTVSISGSAVTDATTTADGRASLGVR